MRVGITKRSVLWLAILSALSLIALAILQYRWINELGASEREALDSALERALRNIREEFNAEIGALLERTMRGPERSPESFAARFGEACATVRHPQAVRAFYVSENQTLYRAAGKQLAPVEWPAYLQEFHEGLRQVRDFGPPPRPGWIESPPAIVLPRQPGPPPPPRDRSDAEPPPRPRPAWVVFEFDSPFLKENLLPELVARHLGSDYDVEFFSTDSGQRMKNPDRSIGLFEVHLERPRDRRNPGAPPRHDPPPPPQFETPRFQLAVKHHSGSLDQQVAGVRRRNLGITLAVLLIMGLTSAALVVALNRAEQLNRMQMDFVAGVSHELRTPLAVIRSAGENLADGVVTTEGQTRTYGALVRDEGKRLSSMVEQLLRFAGVESGRAPYTFAVVAAAGVVERVVQECQATLANITVEAELQPGLPNVLADEASLSHCLQNLIGNAVKHGDGKWVRIEAVDQGAEVEFAVSDHGPGIDPSDKAHLFDPFYRGKKAVSDQVHGLGIGLSLVKRVAEAHGGRVDAVNLPQGGARFSLFVPVERRERS